MPKTNLCSLDIDKSELITHNAMPPIFLPNDKNENVSKNKVSKIRAKNFVNKLFRKMFTRREQEETRLNLVPSEKSIENNTSDENSNSYSSFIDTFNKFGFEGSISTKVCSAVNISQIIKKPKHNIQIENVIPAELFRVKQAISDRAIIRNENITEEKPVFGNQKIVYSFDNVGNENDLANQIIEKDPTLILRNGGAIDNISDLLEEELESRFQSGLLSQSFWEKNDYSDDVDKQNIEIGDSDRKKVSSEPSSDNTNTVDEDKIYNLTELQNSETVIFLPERTIQETPPEDSSIENEYTQNIELNSTTTLSDELFNNKEEISYCYKNDVRKIIKSSSSNQLLQNKNSELLIILSHSTEEQNQSVSNTKSYTSYESSEFEWYSAHSFSSDKSIDIEENENYKKDRSESACQASMTRCESNMNLILPNCFATLENVGEIRVKDSLSGNNYSEKE